MACTEAFFTGAIFRSVRTPISGAHKRFGAEPVPVKNDEPSLLFKRPVRRRTLRVANVDPARLHPAR